MRGAGQVKTILCPERRPGGAGRIAGCSGRAHVRTFACGWRLAALDGLPSLQPVKVLCKMACLMFVVCLVLSCLLNTPSGHRCEVAFLSASMGQIMLTTWTATHAMMMWSFDPALHVHG